MDTSVNPNPEVGVSPHPASGERWQPRYWAVFSSQALSLIGSGLTQFVLMWWIADSTGSVTALSLAGLFALLPLAVFGPLGGTFADRYDRRIIMMVTDAISALCMSVLIVLFLTDHVELWHIYVMTAVRAAMQAFQAPAALASTSLLVPQTFLPRAAGFNQAVTGLMSVAAAPMGALAIGVMPIGWALAIDVVTATVAVSILTRVRFPDVPSASAATSEHRLRTELREGVGAVMSSPVLSRIYVLLAVVSAIVMPSFTLVPLLVKLHFGGGAGDVALMEGLAGGGMVAGGLLVARIAPRRPLRWVILGFAACCASLAMTAALPADAFALATVCWTASGVAYVFGNAPFISLLQSTVAHHLQGRVLSLLQTLMGLAAPVGLLLATPTGELLGIRTLMIVAGSLGASVCILAFSSPALRAALRTEAAGSRRTGPPPQLSADDAPSPEPKNLTTTRSGTLDG